MAGRPRKSRAFHVIDGTLRNHDMKKQGRESEAQLPAGEIGECPNWFSPEARATWEHIRNDPDYRQFLATADIELVKVYCVLIGKWERAERGMMAWVNGHEHKEKKESFAGHELYALRAARTDLGRSPVARTRVNAPKKEENSNNRWLRLAAK